MPRKTLIIIIILGVLLTGGALLYHFLTLPPQTTGKLAPAQKPQAITTSALNFQSITQNNIYNFDVTKQELQDIANPQKPKVLLSSMPPGTEFIWNQDATRAVVFAVNDFQVSESPFFLSDVADLEVTAWLYTPSTNQKIRLPQSTYEASFSPKGKLVIGIVSGPPKKSSLFLVDSQGAVTYLYDSLGIKDFTWIDEQRLAVIPRRSEATGNRLSVVNIATGVLDTLIDQPIVGDFKIIAAKNKIVFDYFHESDTGSSYTLGIFDMATNKILDTQKTDVRVSQAALTPAQDKIVFPVKQNESYNFFELNLDSGELLPLSYDHSIVIKDLLDISFFPDGKNLLVNTSSGSFRLTVY